MRSLTKATAPWIFLKALGHVEYTKHVFDTKYCLNCGGHKNKERKEENSEERKANRKKEGRCRGGERKGNREDASWFIYNVNCNFPLLNKERK